MPASRPEWRRGDLKSPRRDFWTICIPDEALIPSVVDNGWTIVERYEPKQGVRRKGITMATQDQCCTVVPYLKVHVGKLESFKALCEQNYGFSFDGDQAHCREGYGDADGVLAHLQNVGTLLEELLKISDIILFEVHGPGQQLEKLRGPLADFKPQFFTLEFGFRR